LLDAASKVFLTGKYQITYVKEMPRLEGHYFVTHREVTGLGKCHRWLLKSWDESLREQYPYSNFRDFLLIGRGKYGDRHLNQESKRTARQWDQLSLCLQK